MKRLGESIRKKWNNSGNICGLFFAVAVLVLLLPGILSGSRLGTVDNGSYEQTMAAAGLTYLPEDLENPDTLSYDHVIERYGYGGFSYWKLLAPNGQCSILYPIALIRLVTQPFGILFSTVYLAVLYAFLFAAGTYMLVRGFGSLGGWLGAIPGALLLLAAGSGNLTAYFGSLYCVGTVVVSLLLMAGTALRMLTYGRSRPGRAVALFLVTVVFCLNASPLCILFAPFAGAALAAFLVREGKKCSPAMAACAVLILLAAVSSSAQYQRESPDISSEASAYQAAFTGLLEASDTPQEDLAFFGLDESYLADIGKSYYLSEEDYAHCPRNPAEAKLLFEKINAASIGAFYRRNPGRLLQTAQRQTEAYNHFESDLVLQVGQTTRADNRVSRTWSAADTLMKLLLPGSYSAVPVLFLLELLAALWMAFRLKKGQGSAAGSLLSALAAALFGMGGCGYVLLHLRYMGRTMLSSARMVGAFAMLLGVGAVCVAAGDAVLTLSAWFRAKQENPVVKSDFSDWQSCLLPAHPRRLGGSTLASRICGSRGAGTFCVLLLAAAMSSVVQLSSVRAGCVNNGDYGRMMEQLGLIWQGDIFYDVNAQLGRRVIENYAFRSAFDWTSLTSLNPKYSLVYPAALVRLICHFTGQDFSTWYLSMIMNTVLICCIVSITYDLYDVLGKYAMLFGLLLCAVFLCESYLVWFNSLFGESCMFMGLFMVIACCVHLAVKPANRCWPSVLLLLFSARILVCAKAQMLVTLPIVLLLVVILALYQRPLSVKGTVLYTLVVLIGCALISLDCISVYNDNANISERQTVWQSTFYGALMISDNPEETMEELGIDPAMLPDIGKDAYHSDDDYVISPNSPAADEALYNHVNTFTMVKYYLRHPVQLLKMLNHAAQASRTMYNDFRAYQGENYAQPHRAVQRLGLWLYWRSFFTFGSFLGYVLLYAAAGAVCILVLAKKNSGRAKMLASAYLGVMLIGAVQYPLSVIGNGFADNQKQMFGFMMCHDFLTLLNVTVLLCCLKQHGGALLEGAASARKRIFAWRK